jgi:predicted nucleic acid-binding Zn ribbon protein
MITLCEKCFEGWMDVEVLSSVPLTACEECGNPPHSKIKAHLFRSDPRVVEEQE